MVNCGDQFWKDRLEKLEIAIIAYEDALIFFANNGIAQSYTLDTGQTRTVVSRAEISSLKNVLKELLSTYDTLCARVCGASYNVRATR